MIAFTKANCAINGENAITHAQTIMGDVIIILPQKFKQTSSWCYQMQEVVNY